MGLRAKFMLVLAGVTAAALIALGVTMALTTNKFLFGQKQHSGVEIAKFAAQLATAVNSKLELIKKIQKTKGFEGVELPVLEQQQVEKELPDGGAKNEVKKLTAETAKAVETIRLMCELGR